MSAVASASETQSLPTNDAGWPAPSTVSKPAPGIRAAAVSARASGLAASKRR